MVFWRLREFWIYIQRQMKSLRFLPRKMFALFSFSGATDKHVQGSRFLRIPAIPQTAALISVSLASLYAPTECPWTPSVPANVFQVPRHLICCFSAFKIVNESLNETYIHYIYVHRTSLQYQTQHWGAANRILISLSPKLLDDRGDRCREDVVYNNKCTVLTLLCCIEENNVL